MILSGSIFGFDSPTSTPAAPASALPSTKVKLITPSMGIPMSRAAFMSKDTARIALPMRVRRMMRVWAVMRTMETARIRT
jgi:hypothetical protein